MKKIFSKMTAVLAVSTCLVSSYAYAVDEIMPAYPYEFPAKKDNLTDQLEGYTEIYSTVETDNNSTSCHVFSDYNSRGFIILDYHEVNSFEIVVLSEDYDKNTAETIREIISSYIPDYLEVGLDYIQEGFRFYVCDLSNNPETFANLRNILNDISEVAEISDFSTQDDYVNVSYPSIQPYAHDITDYVLSDSEQLTALQNYIDENNLNFTIETSFYDKFVNGEQNIYKCHLIPNDSLTLEEQFAAGMQIEKDLGIGMPLISQAINVEFPLISVDVFNSLDGDANEDGKTNMADAAAIVQAIGNSDKYALSAQGKFNADTNGDGLTATDAVTIQMQIAENGMPE